MKYSKVKFGKNIRYFCFPIFIFLSNSKVEIGDNVIFNSNTKDNLVGIFKKSSVFVSNNAKLIIGNNTGFSGVSIYCTKEIVFGQYINCGGNVLIWDTDFHPLNYLDRRVHDIKKINSKPIFIDDDVFIGANSIILKGVKIGKRSIIASGSIVVKDIPDDEIWGGNPARFIKKLNNAL